MDCYKDSISRAPGEKPDAIHANKSDGGQRGYLVHSLAAQYRPKAVDKRRPAAGAAGKTNMLKK